MGRRSGPRRGITDETLTLLAAGTLLLVGIVALLAIA